MMAVTRREQEMLDLAEEGLSRQEIAARMGIKRDSVDRTLGMLSCSVGSDRAWQDAIRRGSQRLGAAVIAAGGHR